MTSLSAGVIDSGAPTGAKRVGQSPILIAYCQDRAEQGLRICRDGRGLESNLVSFSKGFSKRPHILAIIKVDSEYSRLPFKLKVDYFILY